MIYGPRSADLTAFRNLLLLTIITFVTQVVGVPDDKMGEEISAWIILKPNQTMTESELREFCKGKVISMNVCFIFK